uniref:Uncharacterized protein n=1 Tax=Leersia perrieri TaxID=77586 RepID=A0A0D9XV95_9ORYZ
MAPLSPAAARRRRLEPAPPPTPASPLDRQARSTGKCVTLDPFNVFTTIADLESPAQADWAACITWEEALPLRSSWLLPCLTELQLEDCPKLRALPRQLGQQATSLKELLIGRASCLKTVEDLAFLSSGLQVQRCEVLERVSNLPQVRILLVNDCPNLRRVEELANLEQLLLDKDMQEISELWIPGLQEQRRRVHGDELEMCHRTCKAAATSLPGSNSRSHDAQASWPSIPMPRKVSHSDKLVESIFITACEEGIQHERVVLDICSKGSAHKV